MSDYDFENWTSEEITRIQTGTNLKRPSDNQSIIVGPKFSDESRRRLDDIIKGSPYGNIAIRRAKLSKTTFSVEIDD
jgi:hypothetical protein